MSLTFSRYVRFIFHVCPVLSLRVISLHLRLVSLCFVSLSFPLHSPCFHFCPLHVPFSSPLFPFHFPCFPVMSTSYFLPSFPCTSLHFPFAPQYFPQNNAFFETFSQLGPPKAQRRQEPQTSKEPAGGIEPGTPVLRHRLPEDDV